MTATRTTRKASNHAGSADSPTTPVTFVRQLERIFASDGGVAASQYFDQYAEAMVPRLSGEQQTRLEELMHIIDTVSGWTPPPDAQIVTIVSDEENEADAAHSLAPENVTNVPANGVSGAPASASSSAV